MFLIPILLNQRFIHQKVWPIVDKTHWEKQQPAHHWVEISRLINQFDFCALFDRKIAFASYPILVVGWCWFDGFASVIDMLLYVTQFIITRNRFQHFPRRRSPSTQALFLALQLQCVNPNRLHKQKPHSIESLENTLHRSSSIGITDHYHHLPERSNRLMMIIGGNCFSQSTRRTRMVFEPIITPSNTVTTVAQFLDLTPLGESVRHVCMV